MVPRTQVFISYSHADSDHLHRLRVHLKPYERNSKIDVWNDTKIQTGQRWREEIRRALDQAAVAILLVSADFLASDFIAENELPPLLEAAEREGMKIMPVILKPCAFLDVQSISGFQAVNDPDRPLIALAESERERIWVQLARDVHFALQEFITKPEPAVQPEVPMQRPKLPSKSPAILQQIVDAGWKFSALKGLPSPDRPVDERGQRELILEGGALRLYRIGPDVLYALVVNHTQPSYQEFKALARNESFLVAHQGRYTSVLRIAPVSETTRAELASKEWTPQELEARLGKPTNRVHNHGIGSFTVTYVPQGLVFEEATTLKLDKAPAEDIWQRHAELLVNRFNKIDGILAHGKASPDGQFRAAHLNGGVYWSQWMVVRETGKSEMLFQAEYFIKDYFWLDSRRLVYAVVQPILSYEFHVIDAIAGKALGRVKVEDQVEEFGPIEGKAIWYTGKDGVRHQVNVP